MSRLQKKSCILVFDSFVYQRKKDLENFSLCKPVPFTGRLQSTALITVRNTSKFSRKKMLTMGRLWEKQNKKRSGSHLNLSPCGIKHFMNHADAVESHSTYTEQQSVIVCVCMRVWRECLLYLGPCLCVFAHSCAPNIFTQRPCSLFPWNRFCHSAAAKTRGVWIIILKKSLFN